MAAVAGPFAIERIAGEAIAVFTARILAVAANANVTIGDTTTIARIAYNKPTFSIESTVAGAANPLAVVALDRLAGEAIGTGTAAAGDVGFVGRIHVALTAAAVLAGTMCFQTALAAALPPELVYDPPTFMLFWTALNAGNAVEVQGADNDANTVVALPVPKAAPAAWATALLWTVTSKAGHTIFIGN